MTTAPTQIQISPRRDLWDVQTFEQAQRIAKMFATSQLVPEHLRGDIGSIVIALTIADQMDENPIVVLQNIYFVGGKAGWSTQYMIARANRSGVLSGQITWTTEGDGDSLAVTAHATLAATGEHVSETVSMAMARADGWTRNTKYKSMPGHMLKYRSATFLIRLYCPEVMLGMATRDELVDTHERIVLEPEIQIPTIEQAGSRAQQVMAALDSMDSTSSQTEPDLEPAPEQAPAEPAEQAAQTPPKDPTRDPTREARLKQKSALVAEVRKGEAVIGPDGIQTARDKARIPYNSNAGRWGIDKLQTYLEALQEVAQIELDQSQTEQIAF